MIKRLLCAAMLFVGLAAPGWLIQGGIPCIVDQTFSTPGSFIYTACATATLTVETTGGGSGGGWMNISHSGGPGGKGASYAAGPFNFVGGQTYNVIVGSGGPSIGITSNPGTISYFCPISDVDCTTALTTCIGTAMGNYPDWVCAAKETLNPADSQGSTVNVGALGGGGGSGGGAAGGGGSGGGSISGAGANGSVGGNNCSSTGGAGGAPGGGKGGDGVICAGLDGSVGDPGSAPGAGGGGGGGGTNVVLGGTGGNGEVKIHN